MIVKSTNIIRVVDNENFIVDYDIKKKTYRVAYFDDDYHYQDEITFKEIKEDE